MPDLSNILPANAGTDIASGTASFLAGTYPMWSIAVVLLLGTSIIVLIIRAVSHH